MRISHRYKFVFISKPKCASESIRKYLNPFSDVISSQEIGLRCYHDHITMKEVKRCFFTDSQYKWGEYFRFTTLRNPWDLMVSFYHYGTPDAKGYYRWNPEYNPESKKIDFKNWIKGIPKFRNEFSIKHFAFNGDGTKRLANKIIKIENLNAQMKKVCRKLGLPYRPIAKTNITKHKHYREYYDKKTRDVVLNLMKFDVDLGNYEF